MNCFMLASSPRQYLHFQPQYGSSSCQVGNSCLLFLVFRLKKKYWCAVHLENSDRLSLELLFIQDKIVGEVASTECHRLSEKVVKVQQSCCTTCERHLVRVFCAFFFFERVEKSVLQDVLLHKSRPSARRDDPTLATAVLFPATYL